MNKTEAINKAIAVIRRQHKSRGTEDAYIYWLKLYISAIFQMDQTLTSEQKLEQFLSELALKKNVAASTQNQAFNAILFFYRDVIGMPLKNVDALRATRPDTIRHAPTVEQTRQLLAAVKDVGGYPTNLICRLIYGCGMRVGEPLEIRIKDLQFDAGKIFIMGAKGRKDRVVSMPCSLVNELREQADYARHIWKRDVENKIPLQLPNQLAKKYPEFEFAWPWAWLFPAKHPCPDERNDNRIVRYHMHPANVQRAVKEQRRKLAIMLSPHHLRHAYATHCLDRGTNIKALAVAMGHVQIETTALYCHAEALSVRSPLEMVKR